MIKEVFGREILDSRGNPTIEVEIELESGASGWAAVPSGASTGIHEAVELRDGDKSRYLGRGVLKAVDNVNEVIGPAVEGLDATDQLGIDRLMIELDGTPNKGRLGANAILGVSMAVARAAADYAGLPLYQYLGAANRRLIPLPMMNVINGGVHAAGNLDIQEFMIIPAGPRSFKEALRIASETFQHLKKIFMGENRISSVGDEGGIAPRLGSNREALDYILQAIESAGYTPGEDVWLCIDSAASEFYDAKTGIYTFKAGDKKFDSDGLIEYYERLIEDYPIVSIEDPLAEDDWDAWAKITAALGDKVQIIGDDIFVTNTSRIARGIEEKSANSSLIKLNQIGTVTETLDAIDMTLNNGWGAVISHRSGETEDSFIADLAVATGVGQLKSGSICRGERIVKYNRLLAIEEELEGVATFPEPSRFYPRLRK
ncbi:phosphopyruvate hydratase [bacterium]|nr:phosphopyruvate hydratase [bacterium]